MASYLGCFKRGGPTLPWRQVTTNRIPARQEDPLDNVLLRLTVLMEAVRPVGAGQSEQLRVKSEQLRAAAAMIERGNINGAGRLLTAIEHDFLIDDKNLYFEEEDFVSSHVVVDHERLMKARRKVAVPTTEDRDRTSEQRLEKAMGPLEQLDPSHAHDQAEADLAAVAKRVDSAKLRAKGEKLQSAADCIQKGDLQEAQKLLNELRGERREEVYQRVREAEPGAVRSPPPSQPSSSSRSVPPFQPQLGRQVPSPAQTPVAGTRSVNGGAVDL